jgi:hypothetical protein
LTGSIDPSKRDHIVELAMAGMGRNEIAREVGVSGGTVSKVCDKAGILFDRRATELATRAQAVDAKKRRAQMLTQQHEIQFLTQQAMLKTLERRGTWPTLAKGPMGSMETRRLAYIPADDFVKTQNGLNAGMSMINRLEETLNPAAEEAGNLLDQIAKGLGIAPDA